MQDKEYLFDEEDRAIFGSSDLDLKAKALRYHLMPRLEKLIKEAMAMVHEMYGVDPMEFSTISRSPGFRTDRRKGLVVVDYDWCSIGLCGVRKPIWKKVKRAKDSKEPTVLYLKWGLELLDDGLAAVVSTPYGIPLDANSYETLLRPLIKHAGALTELYRGADAMLMTNTDDHRKLRTLQQRLTDTMNSESPEVLFMSKQQAWPITDADGHGRAHALATLFPIFDAWIRAAQGLEPRLEQLLEHYEDYQRRIWEDNVANETAPSGLEPTDPDVLRKLANDRVIALPARRFQVFQRDGWRCVSCGRNPDEHPIILHVDHITPRSKGGADALDNYQTLCDLCNLGKSNRDDTNIRELLRNGGKQ